MAAAANGELRDRIGVLEREVEKLRRSLLEERAASRALEAGQVDAVVDSRGGGALLLSGAQDALRASEERYRTIVSTAHEGIWTADANGVTFANERMASMLGYRVEELVGLRNEDLVDSAALEETLKGVERRKLGIREHRDLPLRRKDGTILWASVTSSPLRDAEGHVTGSLGMVTDVTERRRAEENLRETRYLLEQAQAVGHIGSWAADLESNRILWWSEETKRIYGVADTGSDYTATLYALIHADDRERVRATRAEAFGEGGHHVVEYRINRPDGEVRVVHVEALMIRGDGGRPAKLVGVVQDVTDRNAAEERLRESEERYRVLFDDSPMPMLAFDKKSLRIVMANEAAAEQYGYSREEILALNLPDLRLAEPPERLRELIASMPRGRKFIGTMGHRRKDGSLLDVDVHVNDVLLGGRDLGLGILHDVTQRRSLEEQLRQSQKMEAVGRLAGGVAHDFNNLLTAILGYSDILANRFPVGRPERAEIQEIRRAGERAAGLTRQLLAFSRKQVLVPVALDLGGVVRGLTGMLGRLIGEDITISVVVAPDLGHVLADPGQMEQVVMNLALNSRDAMPRGGELLIEIRNIDIDEAYVGANVGAALGPYVLLAVTDTGVGMTPEVKRQIFEPFFSTKAPGQGTGLGLSTVHGIVNQSGGTIWVYSEPGHGTTFKIYLPRVAGEVAGPKESSGSIPAFRGTGTILLVEDEEQLRTLGKRILELNHYVVLEAGSPSRALAVSRQHEGAIDLLLTDVVMPGMSGTELAAALLLERPGMPVLYMSGYTDDAIVHHGVLTPGTLFMQKPFTPSALIQRVREAMNPVTP